MEIQLVQQTRIAAREYGAGEIVTIDDYTARRLIAHGYAEEPKKLAEKKAPGPTRKAVKKGPKQER